MHSNFKDDRYLSYRAKCFVRVFGDGVSSDENGTICRHPPVHIQSIAFLKTQNPRLSVCGYCPRIRPMWSLSTLNRVMHESFLPRADAHVASVSVGRNGCRETLHFRFELQCEWWKSRKPAYGFAWRRPGSRQEWSTKQSPESPTVFASRCEKNRSRCDPRKWRLQLRDLQ
jgi:hypothetical protein